MVINLDIHRFISCNGFPPGVNLKVKQKMTTTDIRQVTCSVCKARIVANIQSRNWRDLASIEVEALELSAAELES